MFDRSKPKHFSRKKKERDATQGPTPGKNSFPLSGFVLNRNHEWVLPTIRRNSRAGVSVGKVKSDSYLCTPSEPRVESGLPILTTLGSVSLEVWVPSRGMVPPGYTRIPLSFQL